MRFLALMLGLVCVSAQANNWEVDLMYSFKGGDDYLVLSYTDGSEESIAPGEGLGMNIGRVIYKENNFDLFGRIGFMWDSIDEVGIESSYVYYPIELVGRYHVNEHVQFGLGGQYVLSPKYTEKVGSNELVLKETSGLGLVLEGRFQAGKNLNTSSYVFGRFVSNSVSPKSATFNGDSLTVNEDAESDLTSVIIGVTLAF